MVLSLKLIARATFGLATIVFLTTDAVSGNNSPTNPVRVGIVGLDTPHASEFARILNDTNGSPERSGCRVVAAVDQYSPDNEESARTHPEIVKAIGKMGIEIVPSVADLLNRVDAVLIESIDGRPHLESASAVLKAGLPVFIDKPIGSSLAEVFVIDQLARTYKAPWFSSSALRFADDAVTRTADTVGSVLACDVYSPAPTEPHHPHFFWYGIHGVEMLYTAMGPGCESVCCVGSNDSDVAVGKWAAGRIGTFRGLRTASHGYGGTVFGDKGIRQVGGFSGYEPLVVQVARFFRERKSPVSNDETIEIYVFMAAAEESRQLGGAPVNLDTVHQKAMDQARSKLTEMGIVPQ